MASTKPDQQPSLLASAISLILAPLRPFFSPLALRAYFSTILLFISSLVLLFLSSIAYLLFYHAYVPHAAVSVPVYLQYAYTPGSALDCPPASQLSTKPSLHPYGTALLLPTLSSNQKYDISVLLHMPRSPTNLRAGNFMLDLALLAPTSSTASDNPAHDPAAIEEEARAMLQESSGTQGSGIPGNLATVTEGVVARARRPSILPYKSWEVDMVRKLVGLPWYAIGWREESEKVEIRMLEGVEFTRPKTRNIRGALGIPDRVRIVMESREVLEVYGVTIEVKAKLSGLRWVMSRFRIGSFVVGTGLFYVVVMGTVVVVFGGLTVRQVLGEIEDSEMDGARKGSRRIKQESANEDGEDTGLSDTSRTFPSRPGREPLKYTGRGRKYEDEETIVKKEEAEEDAALAAAGIAYLEADDEDNADDYDYAEDSFRDSGIGTSREERDRSGARRRKRLSGAGVT